MARIALRDGNAMPQLGFGTWQIADAACPEIVGQALRAGYRAIDTAQAHGNEVGIGEAIRRSGLARGDIFVISKLANGAHARDLALASVDQSLADLGLDRLDLLLIHWPVPAQDRYVEAWQALIELQQQGRVNAIGVSNFEPAHIDRLIGATGVVPAFNQVELHPRFQQRDLRGYHKRHDIRLQSWSPLGPGNGGAAWWARFGRAPGESLLADPAIAAIAERHGKTPAQIVIRWHIEEGLMLFPKSSHAGRIAENFDVFDFRLDAEDMYRLEALDDENGRIGAAPGDWNSTA